MRALKFITGHVIFKLPYDQIYQMKTTFDHLPPSVDIFYLINVDEESTFLDYLPPFSCKRSL